MKERKNITKSKKYTQNYKKKIVLFLLSIYRRFRECARSCEMLIDFEDKNNILIESRLERHHL